LLEELEYYYKAFTQHGFNLILEEWKSLTSTLHAYVEVTSFDKKVKGWAVDVDQDGALLIKLEDGSITRVMSGDVRVRVQR
jgi:BirA family biotin operon repressor/biotin-[acetyl-CoA-carboxylase] ligase